MSNFMCKLFAKLSGTIIVVACIHKKRDDELPTFSQLFLCSYFFLSQFFFGHVVIWLNEKEWFYTCVLCVCLNIRIVYVFSWSSFFGFISLDVSICAIFITSADTHRMPKLL